MMLAAVPTHSHVICGSSCKAAPPVQAGLSEQITGFFSKIFDTSDWPARWQCGTWSDFHGWLYVISDICIWAAYFTIPILLVRILIKRKDIPFHRVFLLFAAFILLCGLSHLADAAIFWWPAYRLSALIRFATAVASMITVYELFRLMPVMLGLRSVKQLEAEVEKRRLVEEKLAASEFLLSEAGRIGRVGGWEMDLLTQKSIWSKTIYDIYELPYETDVDSIDALSYFPEPYRQTLADSIEDTRTNGTKWDIELLMVTEKNSTIWVRSIGEPMYDEAGNMIKLRGVFMDIDKYKANELALNKSLELITRNNNQLKNFGHILSHNIRNHSSNISLISSLIDADTLDDNNAELFEKLGNVSTRLNATLDSLSEAMKIKEGFIGSELVDFAGVTYKALNIFESELVACDGKMSTEFEVESVNFPPIYLESIMVNLISNAIKYRMPDRPPRILLKTYKDAEFNTVLECHDNGSGIDLALHGKKIFGLYKTFHDRKDSNGVGLFLMKTQVESQGGSIEVESVPAEGSVFKIIFNE